MCPTYPWECPRCTHVTDVTRPMSEYETPPNECDKCRNEGANLTRIVVRPTQVKGFILLGFGGWERDEYTKYRSIK